VHGVVTGNGPDLVLIHGLNGNTRDFTFGLVDQLKTRYRVIVLDRPGLGWSDRLPVGSETIFDQARHLKDAAIALGADKPLVLGQSYGGAVALAWALDHPDHISGLITLAGPSHLWPTGPSAFYRITANPIGAITAVPLITALVSDSRVEDGIDGIFAPQATPDGYHDYVGAGLSLRRETLRANARHRVTLKDEIEAMLVRYEMLDLPYELVHGTADITVDIDLHARAMLRDVSSANLTALQGVGHMPQHVAQEPVISAIDRAAERAGLR
jgi:pimeloyl-ACP methyl ester carboxylesterase